MLARQSTNKYAAMSNKEPKKICQELVAFIENTLYLFLATATQITRGQHPLAVRLNQAQLALFAAAWPGEGRRKIIITDKASAASHLQAACQQWTAALGANVSWQALAGKLTEQEQSGHIVTSLSRAYHTLLGTDQTAHFVIPAKLLAGAVPSLTHYRRQTLALTVGEQMPLTYLVSQLARLGYARRPSADEAGTFSVQGEVLTVAHPVTAEQYTITLWHNTIEQLASATKRRARAGGPGLRPRHSLALPPAALPAASQPLTRLCADAYIFRPRQLVNVPSRGTVIYDAIHADIDFPLRAVQDARRATHRREIWLMYENRERVAHLIGSLATGQVHYCRHDIARLPVALTTDQAALISEAALAPLETTSQPVSYRRAAELIRDLAPGRPAVHSDHGIGIYEGLQTKTYGRVTREYLLVRYAAGDSLAVPVEYAHKVTPYLGTTTPIIHRLHTAAWTRNKRAARVDAIQFARDLLAIAARRHAAARRPFRIDPHREATLSETLPFSLTTAQAHAWQDTQRDLTSRRPMDRLIVGDVGFGKTEIALRAACHVAANGAQVAVLAPTTLLADQHTRTFQNRFPDLAKRLATLSRFTPARHFPRLRAQIASGEIYIVIGTHALLNSSLTWKNLGLVIIDEEQRFGVGHKEHFKHIRAAIDVLSLSATPIPRTLSLALSGFKSISHIDEPPPGRKAVRTFVGQDTDETLRQAIAHERARDGQVFVVAPRIRHLGALAHRLHRLVPQAKITLAHGRLPSTELARTMRDFSAGQSDILLSSSIIESGLDLPNTNTIIVLNATYFGLADLYQLRGRIGRRSRQGFAYFLYDQHNLTSRERERLTALTEAARLGSGWALAQRDLELRGAGNILGAEQSGSVTSVGLQLFLDMVREASRRLNTPIHPHDVDIQLPISAYLPPDYIADSVQRTAAYQNLARAASRRELGLRRQTLERHFGPMPDEARNLYHLLELQHAAAASGVQVITSRTVTPPRGRVVQRLTLTAINSSQALAKLHTLGTWRVRDNALTLDVPAINPALVQQLTSVLE